LAASCTESENKRESPSNDSSIKEHLLGVDSEWQAISLSGMLMNGSLCFPLDIIPLFLFFLHVLDWNWGDEGIYILSPAGTKFFIHASGWCKLQTWI